MSMPPKKQHAQGKRFITTTGLRQADNLSQFDNPPYAENQFSQGQSAFHSQGLAS